VLDMYATGTRRSCSMFDGVVVVVLATGTRRSCSMFDGDGAVLATGAAAADGALA
jgi:hypothetical protein